MTNIPSHPGSPRIVFMGTPEFAVASLDALVRAEFNVVAVITAPDKPAGRGLKLHQSAVKQYAEQHHIQVLQPEKLKDPVFLKTLHDIHADVQVVVAFRMLPEKVWNMPPMGTINLHGSLLPQYRGAAPINWAIINGEKETGVTTFRLKHEIDTGNVLLQERIPIGKNETAGELHDVMKETGAQLLVKTIRGIWDRSLEEKPQSALMQTSAKDDQLKHAPKIFTDTCRINWHLPAEKVHNLIRGLSPFPGAFTTFRDATLKIYRSELLPGTHNKLPGTFETDKKSFLHFAAADGFIQVKELQLEGKRKMKVDEFLRGYRFD